MSKNFSIQPIGRFAGASQPVKRPKVRKRKPISNAVIALSNAGHLQEFACFSYDDNHEYKQDDSSMKYYYTPQLGVDLSRGFDTFVKRDDTQPEHLDSLLRTIIAHEKEAGQRIDADLVTWRGIMTKV